MSVQVTDPTQVAPRISQTPLIRLEGIKKHFKDNAFESLGHLWPDYRDFCEMPDLATEKNFHFCRRFRLSKPSSRRA